MGIGLEYFSDPIAAAKEYQEALWQKAQKVSSPSCYQVALKALFHQPKKPLVLAHYFTRLLGTSNLI
jgi:hypothetical protein